MTTSTPLERAVDRIQSLEAENERLQDEAAEARKRAERFLRKYTFAVSQIKEALAVHEAGGYEAQHWKAILLEAVPKETIG